MGVTGLWQLIEPTGRTVPREALRGQRVAVDASIWLVQFAAAMRDSEGRPIAHAHLKGMLRRVSRLLVLGAKPVLVFDGKTPELKQRTLQRRRNRMLRGHEQFRVAAQRLLATRLKRRLGARLDERPPTSETTVEETGEETAEETVKNEEFDGLDDFDDLNAFFDDERKTSEDESEQKTQHRDPDEIDVDSLDIDALIQDTDTLARMPMNVQLEVLERHRLKRQDESRVALVTASAAPSSFSEHQLEHFLKRSHFHRRLTDARNLVSARRILDDSAQEARAQRIPASATRRFQYYRVESAEVEGVEREDYTVDRGVPWFGREHRLRQERRQRGEVTPSKRRTKALLHARVKPSQPRDQASLSEWTCQCGRRNRPNALVCDECFTQRDSASAGFIDFGADSLLALPSTEQQKQKQEKSKQQKAVESGEIDDFDDDFAQVGGFIASDDDEQLGGFLESESEGEIESKIADENKDENAVRNKGESDAEADETEIDETEVDETDVDDDMPVNAPIDLIKNNMKEESQEIVPAEGSQWANQISTLASVPNTRAEFFRLFSQQNEPPSKRRRLQHTPETETSVFSLSPATPQAATPKASDETSDLFATAQRRILQQEKSSPVQSNQRMQISSSESDEANAVFGESIPGLFALNDEQILEAAEERKHERQVAEQRKKVSALMQDETGRREQQEQCCVLLEWLGVPYIVAPFEAEAQCAALEQQGLVDAIITDDSDVFLFGGKKVYRRVFGNTPDMQVFDFAQIRKQLCLTRNMLIDLALLLGSDYTDGVRGIGPVNGFEAVTALPLTALKQWMLTPPKCDIVHVTTDADGHKKRTIVKQLQRPQRPKKPSKKKARDVKVLAKYATDMRTYAARRFRYLHRNIRKEWVMPPDFPNAEVRDAYLAPRVASPAAFRWRAPNRKKLQNLCGGTLGLSAPETQDLLDSICAGSRRREAVVFSVFHFCWPMT
ncbi:MAG: hypothetical protein MHM6MM_003795 [Cercozoa sp. M6MM]